MLKAYNESNSAKTFGTNNNSSLGPNIIVEYDPPVTGISLSSTCKEVNVGWSGYISAAVYPASALNKTVYWESSDPNVASVNPASGLICAGLAGSTVITATTADGGFKATCTLTVHDPYGVNYVNLTRISDSTGACTLSITKFYNGDFYFQAFDDTDFGELYNLSSTNISWLNNTYNAYNSNPDNYSIFGVERKVWMAKNKLINAISDKSWNVSLNSDEFYGLWMHFTRVEVAYAEATQLVAQMVQTAVIIGATVYQTVVTVKSIGMLVNQKRSITAIEYSTMSGYTSQIESRLGSNISNRTTTTAEIRNSTLGLSKEPYKPGTPVVGFKPTQTTQYVRVYTEGVTNPAGKWIMKYSDIQGLTPAQIKSKFALPDLPTHYCYVNVPSTTQMYSGIANEVSGWGAGGGVQFELAQSIPKSAFGNGIALP